MFENQVKDDGVPPPELKPTIKFTPPVIRKKKWNACHELLELWKCFSTFAKTIAKYKTWKPKK